MSCKEERLEENRVSVTYWTIRSQRKERRDCIERLFKEIMAETVLNLMKTIVLQI